MFPVPRRRRRVFFFFLLLLVLVVFLVVVVRVSEQPPSSSSPRRCQSRRWSLRDAHSIFVVFVFPEGSKSASKKKSDENETRD